MATFLEIKSLKDTLSGLLQSIPSQNVDQKLLFDESSLSDIIKEIQEDIPVQEVEFDLLEDVEPVELTGISHSTSSLTRDLPKLRRLEPGRKPPQKKLKPKIERVESLQTQKMKEPPTINQLRAKALEFQANLERAVIACKHGSSLEEASFTYNVPSETIWRNVKNFKLPHINSFIVP